MDVKTVKKIIRNDAGQSMLEFVLLLPLFIGIFFLMLRLNSATQISIVNQKYARTTTLRLTYNHPWFVKFSPVGTTSNGVNAARYHRETIGISDEFTDGNRRPIATSFLITRTPASARGETKDANAQSEPAERAFVRIRNTVTLCLPWSFDSRKQSIVANYPGGRELDNNDEFNICDGPAEMAGN